MKSVYLHDAENGWIVGTNDVIIRIAGGVVSLQPGNNLQNSFAMTRRELRYALPLGSYVKAALRSIDGRSVYVVQDGLQRAGEYSLEIPALPPGAYVLDFRNGASQATQRIILP
jgi:hypothetical protein